MLNAGMLSQPMPIRRQPILQLTRFTSSNLDKEASYCGHKLSTYLTYLLPLRRIHTFSAVYIPMYLPIEKPVDLSDRSKIA